MKVIRKYKCLLFLFLLGALVAFSDAQYASALPENLANDSRIEYSEAHLGDTYGKYMIIGGTVIILETVLIIALVLNRRKRRRAENALLILNDCLEALVEERNRELQATKTRLEEVYRDLDYSARIDLLTGLYNRRHMEERLQAENHAFIRTGRVYTIMIIGIDNFKQINDNYGHAAGNAVLKKITKLLRERTREYDVTARWNEEEFLLLFPGLKKNNTISRAELIRKEVEEATYSYNKNDFPVTVTIGVASIRNDETIEKILIRVDNSLYIGRKTGKNKVVIAP